MGVSSRQRGLQLKAREAKVVQTRGTDSRLVFAERRERVGVWYLKGSGSKQAKWSREYCGSAWQV